MKTKNTKSCFTWLKNIFVSHPINKASLCLTLSMVSLVSVGFSSWMLVGGSVEMGPIDVTVGNIVDVEGLELKDFGFDIVSNGMTGLNTTQRLNIADDSVAENMIDDKCFLVSTTVDIQKMTSIAYSDDCYLTISFAYEGYSSVTDNIIDSLWIYPQNYLGYIFQAKRSATINQERKGKQTMFSFPLKTKNDVSLSSVALLDSTYPSLETHGIMNYKVPVMFEFELRDGTIQPSIVDSNPNYTITFGLSKTAVD